MSGTKSGIKSGIKSGFKSGSKSGSKSGIKSGAKSGSKSGIESGRKQVEKRQGTSQGTSREPSQVPSLGPSRGPSLGPRREPSRYPSREPSLEPSQEENKLKNQYIFDVDGTLTEPRKKINETFSDFFIQFCDNNISYLVSGSDPNKTITQLGNDIIRRQKRIYSCAGNYVWNCLDRDVDIIRMSCWNLPKPARKFLEKHTQRSKNPLNVGHYEQRTGIFNYSTLTTNPTQKMRDDYSKNWGDERYDIVSLFNEEFPKLEAVVGGAVSIDIYPKGKDKGQIVQDFNEIELDNLHFFGDRIAPGGNDMPLANKLKNTHPVTCWQDTMKILEEMSK